MRLSLLELAHARFLSFAGHLRHRTRLGVLFSGGSRRGDKPAAALPQQMLAYPRQMPWFVRSSRRRRLPQRLHGGGSVVLERMRRRRSCSLRARMSGRARRLLGAMRFRRAELRFRVCGLRRGMQFPASMHAQRPLRRWGLQSSDRRMRAEMRHEPAMPPEAEFAGRRMCAERPAQRIVRVYLNLRAIVTADAPPSPRATAPALPPSARSRRWRGRGSGLRAAARSAPAVAPRSRP